MSDLVKPEQVALVPTLRDAIHGLAPLTTAAIAEAEHGSSEEGRAFSLQLGEQPVDSEKVPALLKRFPSMEPSSALGVVALGTIVGSNVDELSMLVEAEVARAPNAGLAETLRACLRSLSGQDSLVGSIATELLAELGEG